MAFVAGIVGVALLYGLQLLLGWAVWVPPDSAVGRYVFEGLLVGFGVGLAEELIFSRMAALRVGARFHAHDRPLGQCHRVCDRPLSPSVIGDFGDLAPVCRPGAARRSASLGQTHSLAA